jgi:hypothetical protein
MRLKILFGKGYSKYNAMYRTKCNVKIKKRLKLMRELRSFPQRSLGPRTGRTSASNQSALNHYNVPAGHESQSSNRLQQPSTESLNGYQVPSGQTWEVMFVNPVDLSSSGPAWPTSCQILEVPSNLWSLEETREGEHGNASSKYPLPFTQNSMTHQPAAPLLYNASILFTRSNAISKLADQLPGRSSSSLRRVLATLRLSCTSSMTSGSRWSFTSRRSSRISRQSFQLKAEDEELLVPTEH